MLCQACGVTLGTGRCPACEQRWFPTDLGKRVRAQVSSESREAGIVGRVPVSAPAPAPAPARASACASLSARARAPAAGLAAGRASDPAIPFASHGASVCHSSSPSANPQYSHTQAGQCRSRCCCFFFAFFTFSHTVVPMSQPVRGLYNYCLHSCCFCFSHMCRK
jgi:hypothetical protein